MDELSWSFLPHQFALIIERQEVTFAFTTETVAEFGALEGANFFSTYAAYPSPVGTADCTDFFFSLSASSVSSAVKSSAVKRAETSPPN